LEGAVGGVVYGVVTFLPQRVAGDELREEGHGEDGDIARECMRDHGGSQGGGVWASDRKTINCFGFIDRLGRRILLVTRGWI
jgi:hypothetical protein